MLYQKKSCRLDEKHGDCNNNSQVSSQFNSPFKIHGMFDFYTPEFNTQRIIYTNGFYLNYGQVGFV